MPASFGASPEPARDGAAPTGRQAAPPARRSRRRDPQGPRSPGDRRRSRRCAAAGHAVLAGQRQQGASASAVAATTRPVLSPKSSASGRMPDRRSVISAPTRRGPREAALGQGHGQPAVGDVVGGATRPRDARRRSSSAVQARLVREVDGGRMRRPRGRAAGASHSLPPSSSRVSPSSTTARPGGLEVRRRRAAPSRRAAPPPRWWASGRSRGPRSRCRRTRCPTPPGVPSASAASPMPRVASANSHMISGFSGLPKLRQLVSASGRAPVQATLRAASATAATGAGEGVEPAPARVAVHGQRHALAGGRAVGALHPHERRVAARARPPCRPAPAGRTGDRSTPWSPGWASRAAPRAPPRVLGLGRHRRRGRASGARRRSAGSRTGPVELGRCSSPPGPPGCRPPRSPCQRMRMRPSSVTRAHHRRVEVPALEDLAHLGLAGPARATSSMRSWLSESSSS